MENLSWWGSILRHARFPAATSPKYDHRYNPIHSIARSLQHLVFGDVMVPSYQQDNSRRMLPAFYTVCFRGLHLLARLNINKSRTHTHKHTKLHDISFRKSQSTHIAGTEIISLVIELRMPGHPCRRTWHCFTRSGILCRIMDGVAASY